MTANPARNIRAVFLAGAACAVAITLHRDCRPAAAVAPLAAAIHVNFADQNLDDWVGGGKDALGKSGGVPWYDPKTDGVTAPTFAKERVPIDIPSWLLTLMKWSAWAFIAVILCGLALLLIRAYLDRETSTAMVHVGSDAVTIADRVDALPFAALLRSEDDLLAAARRHFEAGNYSEAIVYLFSHQLVELDRAQCIRLAKGKTNRQYLKELASRADLRGLLALTMDRFEMVFFGAHPLDRDAFETCWRRLPEFEQLLAGSKP